VIEEHTHVAKGLFYPLIDTWLNLSREQRISLGVEDGTNQSRHVHDLRAISTGEKRKPKAGEWFLSGAIVGAYYTRHDLETVYHIARIVRVKKETTYTIIAE